MSTVVKDLGAVSAYAYAVEKGYTGTEAEFAELMADYAEVGQRAEDAADSALESKTAAQTAATTATNKASEATTAATTATNKAAEAQADADAAALDASQALSAASTATSKATEATTAAATATSAKTDAVAANTAAQSAKTAAQTAQTGAETAAASVSASAAQIATNTEDISQLKSDFADIQSDGIVPSAEQILTDKGITDSVPYHYRKTGGDGADRLYDQIVGGTVCFNQLFNTSNYAQSTTISGITFTNNGDGTVTANGTATDRANFQLGTITVIGGHVYIYGTPDTNNAERWIGNSTYGVQNGKKYMEKETTSGSVGLNCMVASGTTLNNYVFKPQYIDLTAMFGSTVADYIYQLEQTTAGAGVAFFKALFPNDYYPYNVGELVSVSGLSKHKMVGFNQWDEEWELASINWSTRTFTPAVNGGRLSPKNYIPVLPNTTYYVTKWPDNIIVGYDNDNPTNGYNITVIAGRFTTPSNCHFIKFGLLTDNYGKTYKNDICINLSDPAKNGTYEPYKAHSYPLDSNLTLRGIPKLVDGKMCFDGDTYDADGTVTRKYGIVDLGTLTWEVASGIFRANVPNFASHADYTSRNEGFVCQKYPADTQISISESSMTDKTALRVAGGLYIKDTSYVDSSSFKTAMSGVMLVYELATPTTEEADPYQHLQQCDPSGTEEYVSTGIVPVGHNSFYPENLRAKIEQLPWNFASLIAPTESAFTATRNYTTGALFIVQNVLYKATSNIANGGTITPNTNCTATTLAEIISALA